MTEPDAVVWAAAIGAAGVAVGVVLGLLSSVIQSFFSNRREKRIRRREFVVTSIEQTIQMISSDADNDMERAMRPPNTDESYRTITAGKWPLASRQYVGDKVILTDFLDLEYHVTAYCFWGGPSVMDLPDFDRLWTAPHRAQMALHTQLRRAVAEQSLHEISDVDWERIQSAQRTRFVHRPADGVPGPASG